jgi:hypothetical protein
LIEAMLPIALVAPGGFDVVGVIYPGDNQSIQY